MKKHLFFYIVVILMPFGLLADTAPVMPVQSGCVVPVNNDIISMQSEIVTIHMYQEYYEVNVEYFFKNTGEAQNVTMGFPNQTSSMFTETIENFKAYFNDTSFSITQKFEPIDTSKPESAFLPKKFYECFEVYFAKGETKKIVNTYSQKYESDYNETYRHAEYILTTGALWQNKIQNIKVYIYVPGIPAEELYSRTAYFQESEKAPIDTIGYPALRFSPDFSFSSGTYYYYEASNIDPDFDIKITMPPRMQFSVSASSELKPEGVYSYEAQNVNDNDPNTAWVEGVTGPGINETINFTIAPRTWGGKNDGAYKLKKIGFMNGPNSSTDLFYANNRVKKVLVQYSDVFNYEEHEYIAELKDIMGMQYIILPKTELISNVQITILEVYPGNKYDDTCISEIQFFPE
jgi:hypothetical protein